MVQEERTLGQSKWCTVQSTLAYVLYSKGEWKSIITHTEKGRDYCQAFLILLWLLYTVCVFMTYLYEYLAINYRIL